MKEEGNVHIYIEHLYLFVKYKQFAHFCLCTDKVSNTKKL